DLPSPPKRQSVVGCPAPASDPAPVVREDGLGKTDAVQERPDSDFVPRVFCPHCHEEIGAQDHKCKACGDGLDEVREDETCAARPREKPRLGSAVVGIVRSTSSTARRVVQLTGQGARALGLEWRKALTSKRAQTLRQQSRDCVKSTWIKAEKIGRALLTKL